MRTPGLTALMVTAIALGIGVCVTTMTVYHAISGNPIWWKNDRLYAVTMDSWPSGGRSDYGVGLLTYRDAMALMAAPIPGRRTISYLRSGVLSGATVQAAPLPADIRVTTAGFFAMFDVPFLYGSSWSPEADRAAGPVAVLSREVNAKLFGGVNSVGRTLRWNGRQMRVVGVLDSWNPLPKFYDLLSGHFGGAEDVYVPFAWTEVLGEVPEGPWACPWREKIDSFKEFRASGCAWLQMWVELPDRLNRDHMQVFMDQYWAEQRQRGRFPRPRNNHLTKVGDWLDARGVVTNDDRLLAGLAFAFLGVCLINTTGVLLVRFRATAALTGVRRALGASRRQIFAQHLVEVGVITFAGGLLGLAAGALGLAGVRALFTVRVGTDTSVAEGYGALTHFDGVSIIWAILLAVLSALAAGLYPAWRSGRVLPATYLKSQ